MDVGGFDWDSGNWPKCGKHGVGREEIEWILKNGGIFFDLNHSRSEPRWYAIGRISNRWILVVFTLRMIESIEKARPISARYMHSDEVRRYEQDNRDQD
jgi:uncharacterized DUF497 family protein